MAKQERARVTRNRVLIAAGDAFARQGYHQTTVDQVLALSGVSKGALYFHFAGKEALADGVLAHLQGTDLELPGGRVRLQALIELVHTYVAAPATDPILRGALRLAAEPDFVYAEGHRHVLAAVTALLEEAARSGELLPHVHPPETAELIITIVSGLRLYESPPTDERDARLVTMWRHLLPSVAMSGVIAALDLGWHPSVRPEPDDSSGDLFVPRDAPAEVKATGCESQAE